MNFCIIHTPNIEILFNFQDPYKHFDMKNLEFHLQKATNHPPLPKKNCIEYSPLSWEIVLLAIIIKYIIEQEEYLFM